MKSQNKNNKLAFRQNTIVELNENTMQNINGGAAQSKDMWTWVTDIITRELNTITH